MGQPNLVSLETDALKRTTEPHGKVFVASAPVKGFSRRRLVHVENEFHEAQFSSVVQIAEMAKKAGKLHPPGRIDGWKLFPADKQLDRRRAAFKGHRGIVERRSSGAYHCNRLSCKRSKIDLIRGVGIAA